MKNNKPERDGRAGNKKPNKGSMTSHQKANRSSELRVGKYIYFYKTLHSVNPLKEKTGTSSNRQE